jgi:hypothetical protein
LGLRPGDRLTVTVAGDVVEIRREPRDLVSELEGILLAPEPGGDLWPELRSE